MGGYGEEACNWWDTVDGQLKEDSNLSHSPPGVYLLDKRATL